MNKIKFLPFVALTYAVSTVVIAGGDAIDASTSLVDSSDTAIVEATPVVEALSLDSSTVVEGLSPKASVSTVSAAASSALDSSSALTDGQSSGGFEAFEDARMKFDVRYYLVAILFILFDLEIAFLFPWAVVLPDIGLFGFLAMMVFLFILVVGFIYEWKKGALEWD